MLRHKAARTLTMLREERCLARCQLQECINCFQMCHLSQPALLGSQHLLLQKSASCWTSAQCCLVQGIGLKPVIQVPGLARQGKHDKQYAKGIRRNNMLSDVFKRNSTDSHSICQPKLDMRGASHSPPGGLLLSDTIIARDVQLLNVRQF